jgi:5-methylcytosine-specific restriction endonuclease McrA
MALKDLLSIDRSVKPLTREEGMRILERDRYRCQYCGLDGLAHFENSLIMTVDFVVPRMRQGTRDETNLLTACRPCNLLKGNRKFMNVEEAKTYVLQKRAELRREWDEKVARFRANSAAGARG